MNRSCVPAPTELVADLRVIVDRALMADRHAIRALAAASLALFEEAGVEFTREMVRDRMTAWLREGVRRNNVQGPSRLALLKVQTEAFTTHYRYAAARAAASAGR